MPTTITAYTFDELTGAARERALKNLSPADCDDTLNECMDSLSALCKVAEVVLEDWSAASAAAESAASAARSTQVGIIRAHFPKVTLTRKIAQ